MPAGNDAPYEHGRAAYIFGLHGPCRGVDTALVATRNLFMESAMLLYQVSQDDIRWG